MSKIILIRHGQASFMAKDYDKLSDAGIAQSEALGEYFATKGIVLDKVYMGELTRHKETFEAFNKAFINRDIELPAPTAMKEFNEHFGQEKMQLLFEDFVGKYDYMQQLFAEMTKNPQLTKKYSLRMFEFFMKEYTSGRYVEDDTTLQTWKDFRIQAKRGAATILDNIKSKETVGVFTSGGTKSSIIGDCLGVSEEKIAELNFVMKNTSFSQLLTSKGKVNLMSMNETPHLDGDSISFI